MCHVNGVISTGKIQRRYCVSRISRKTMENYYSKQINQRYLFVKGQTVASCQQVTLHQC